MLSYIQWAQELGWAVVVADPHGARNTNGDEQGATAGWTPCQRLVQLWRTIIEPSKAAGCTWSGPRWGVEAGGADVPAAMPQERVLVVAHADGVAPTVKMLLAVSEAAGHIAAIAALQGEEQVQLPLSSAEATHANQEISAALVRATRPWL